jgi:hypothetical protein
MTRADKERAVATLVSRLAQVSEDYAFASADRGDGDWEVLQRRQGWLQGAVIRLAMARTVES